MENMKEKIQEKITSEVIAKNIIYFDELNSTQKYAKELAEKRVENGTMVLTNNQIDGIGTHDRKWHSEAGKNISFTLIIYPKCDVAELDTLTVDIAKCMVDTVYELYKIKLDIKKPNDLICNGKKIGGILTQITTLRKYNKIFVNWNRF